MMMMIKNFGNFELNDNQEDDLNTEECYNDRLKIKSLKDMIENEQTEKRKLFDLIQNIPAYQRPLIDNAKLIENFNYKSAEFNEQLTTLKTNYIMFKRHSCVTSLQKLTRITLKEMLVNSIHYGKCLECETITNPFYESGIHLLIRDIDGNCENLILYNYESKFMLNTHPKWLIPSGTKLILKEPHLQLVGLNENEFVIRVDSPTDVVVVDYPDYDRTIDDLISEANKLYESNQYYHALRLVSNAINKSNKTNLKGLLTRAKINISLEKYYAAYQDAKQALKINKTCSEAYCLMGKSAYLMRKFKLALDAFEQAFKLISKNKDIELEIKKTKKRLDEEKNGNFDFKSLYEDYFKKENLFMDIADFESDKCLITDIENKSKGVIAREFIPKGTLLLVNRASSCVFNNNVDYQFKSQLMINYYEDTLSSRNETENISNLIYKMTDDPDFAKNIYSLFAGDTFSRESYDEFPLIDVKRIENIYGFNSFEIKNPIVALEVQELEEELEKAQNIDQEDYSEIHLALIEFESEYYKNLAKQQTKLNNLNNQSGLWYLSAFFNHACDCNALVRTIGDVHVVYAYKDIEKNSEITIRYFPAEWCYTERIKRSIETYGFKCECDFCQQEESDQMRIIREQLLNQIEIKNKNRIVGLLECMNDVLKMRATYVNKQEAQLQLVTPLQILASKYRANWKYNMSAKCYEELFELLKDFNPFGAITVLKEAYNDYLNASLEENSEECKRKAFDYFDSLCFNKIYAEKLWDKMVELCKIES